MVKLYLQDKMDRVVGTRLYVSAFFEDNNNDYWLSYGKDTALDLTQVQAQSVKDQVAESNKNATEANKYTVHELNEGEDSVVSYKDDWTDTYKFQEQIMSHVSVGYKRILSWEARVANRPKLISIIEDHIALTSNLYSVEGIVINVSKGTDKQLMKYFFDNVYKFKGPVELSGIEVRNA